VGAISTIFSSWIGFHNLPKIAGRHVSLDRVTRTTRLDRPPIGGQTALRGKVQLSPKQVYKAKIREEKVEEMDVDPERTTSQDII
jgi:hypothetical protein